MSLNAPLRFVFICLFVLILANCHPAPQQRTTFNSKPEVKPKIDPQRGAMVDRITHQMVEIRGLETKGKFRKKPFGRSQTSKEKLRRYIVEKIQEQYGERDFFWEGVFLKRMGLIAMNLDYQQVVIDFYLKELGGYYDPFEQTLFLADWLDPVMQAPVVAHEVVHALQDAHFNLKPFMGRVKVDGIVNDDRTLARQALAEGDATLAMYFQRILEMEMSPKKLSQDQLESVQEQILKMNQTEDTLEQRIGRQTGKVPRYLLEMIYFPYFSGLRFVATLMDKWGSWEKINAAYDRFPRSTEEILHPKKYLAGDDPPLEISLAEAARLLANQKTSWNMRIQNVLGEQGCYVLLTERLPRNEGKRDCAGWGGDRFALFEQGESGAFLVLWLSSWDTVRDAKEFERGIQNYLRKTVSLEQTMQRKVLRKGGEVLFVGVDRPLTLPATLSEALWRHDLPKSSPRSERSSLP